MIQRIFENEWLSKFDNLKHWSERNQLKNESVAEHSYKVVIFTRIMLEELDLESAEFKLDCIDYAMFHDWDEIFLLRDNSHLLKYNDFNGHEIRKALDSYVAYETNKIPFLSGALIKRNLQKGIVDSVKQLVKVADWLALLHHCLIEIELGNKGFNKSALYVCDKLNICIAESRNSLEMRFPNATHPYFKELGKFVYNYQMDLMQNK